VADNSGARMATMIGVIGKGTAQSAGIGDVIVANVKEASATGPPRGATSWALLG